MILIDSHAYLKFGRLGCTTKTHKMTRFRTRPHPRASPPPPPPAASLYPHHHHDNAPSAALGRPPQPEIQHPQRTPKHPKAPVLKTGTCHLPQTFTEVASRRENVNAKNSRGSEEQFLRKTTAQLRGDDSCNGCHVSNNKILAPQDAALAPTRFHLSNHDAKLMDMHTPGDSAVCVENSLN
jgi:hypothetical protein